MKVFRDPIYEYITCTDEELRLIDSPWFQRLRHCSQNGPTRLVYPSLNGTRFEHSLGVMALAEQAVHSLLRKEKYRGEEDIVDSFLEACRRDFTSFLGWACNTESIAGAVRKLVRYAALCHDLGHFPLSHTCEKAFEQVFWGDAIPTYSPQRPCHETISAEVVRHISGDLFKPWIGRGVILTLLCPHGVRTESGGEVLRIENSVFPALHGLLVGDCDIDRLDYLQRDGHLAGTGFGRVDVTRFIDALCLTRFNGRFCVMPNSRALSTVEAVLLGRYKEYKWIVYHHKALFYSQLSQEVARGLFRDAAFYDAAFEEYVPGEGVKEEDYRELVLARLGDPGSELPPLNLYSPGGQGDRRFYSLRPEFLISCQDTHFLDDVWFSKSCRASDVYVAAESPSGDAVLVARDRDFYTQALVERKRCGLTLWKDVAQFREFKNECGTSCQSKYLPQLEELVGEEDRDSISDAAPLWLSNVWPRWRKDEFAEEAWRIIEPYVQSELDTVASGKVRPLLGVVGPIFGKLRENRILARGREKHPYLVEHSALLRQLSDLEAEIPFYIYLVGKADDLDEFRSLADDGALRKKVASGMVQGLLACWGDRDMTEEVKKAWEQAVREVIERSKQ